jgi:hypothetical protein
VRPSALTIAAFLVAAGAVACAGYGKAPPARVGGKGDGTMANSELESALALARSDRPEDQAALSDSLADPGFLARLDAPARSARLRIGAVLTALADNPAPAARRVLTGLTASATFLAADRRVDLLAGALAHLRPPPPEALRFWDAQSGPDSIATPLVIDALCANGSADAIAVLERKLADPRHDPDAKRAWIVGPILEHRNDAPLLRGCARLLAGAGLPRELRPVLVGALFDYQRSWYRSQTPPTPPDGRLASAEARRELRRIAEYSLAHVALDAAQRQAVERALRELDTDR